MGGVLFKGGGKVSILRMVACKMVFGGSFLGWSLGIRAGSPRPSSAAYPYIVTLVLNRFLFPLTFAFWPGVVHFPKVQPLLAAGRSTGFGFERTVDFARLFDSCTGFRVPETVYA